MLRSFQFFFGFSIRTMDGHIGTLKDVYFEDQQWVIRHLVADTGNWLSGTSSF